MGNKQNLGDLYTSNSDFNANVTLTFGNSSVNVVVNSSALALSPNTSFSANNDNGSPGQVLTTNGSGVYWSTISGVNTSSQYTWSNTQTFQNTITFSTRIDIAANAVINSTAYYWVGNTTTSPTVTLANTGSFTIGNSSTTQTSSIISVANSTGNVQITPSGISGNGINITTINATNITVGTLPYARIPVNIVNTTGSFSLSGNTTLAGTNTTISSNLNVTGTFINVASAFIANSSGAYHTGTVNAASHTVGTTFTANATLVNAAAINITGQVNTATFFAATSANVGANLQLTTSQLFVGNATVNSTHNSSSFAVIGNTTTLATATVSSSGLTVGNNSTTQTTSIITVANSVSNVQITPSGFTGNGVNITSLNATSITTGTLPDARLSAAVVNTSGNFTLSGNTTLAGTNTAISSNVNITGTFINVASAFVANSSGAYHTGTMNAASHTVGTTFTANATLVNAAAINITGQVNTATLFSSTSANVGANVQLTTSQLFVGNSTINSVHNSSSFAVIGNTTTLATATISSSGLTVGNGSTTQTGSVITIANSVGNVQITPSGFTGNGINITTINATNITTGTLPYAQIPVNVVNTTGSFTLSGNTTLAGTNTTVSSNLNVTGSFINVASAFVANSSGAYHTGTMNAASHTVGTAFTANATLVNAAAINVVNQTNTATLYVTTSANVGTAFVANTIQVTITSVPISANGSVGTGGQVLTSNGATGSPYWSTPISSVNVAAQYTWTNTHTFQNTITFSTTINIAANAVINSTAYYWVGNTTTSPTVTLANTGAFTIGNSSTTQTASIISVANSVGNVQITPSGITGNGVNITTLNATSITTGTLPDARLSAAVVNTSGNFTLGGNTTLGGTNTTVSSNLNVTGSFINVASAFLANSSGAYHTGTMNAASHTVGTAFTANATLVNAAAINVVNQTNTATLFVTTSANVGTAVIANSVGLTTTGFVNAATVVNSASHTVGTAFTANATLVNAAAINIVGRTNTATLFATTSANVGTAFVANTIQVTITDVPLSANGGVGSGGQVLTSNGATGSPYWSTVSGVNTAAQYTWTNTHTFTANVTIGNSSVYPYMISNFGYSNPNTFSVGTLTTTASLNTLLVGPYTIASGNSLIIAAGSRVVIV